MNCEKVTLKITKWLNGKLDDTKQTGFVVGVSGGVDSAVVSTLCAMTGRKTILLELPIQQKESAFRAKDHMQDLKRRFGSNVFISSVDLSNTFDELVKANEVVMPEFADYGTPDIEFAKVNARSRIRMSSLYFMANCFKCIVVGTGNKVEDYGVGFFTKYGDGGVDVSPIGALIKTEVWELAKHINVIESIQTADPSDDLWDDGRTDEDQLGSTYPLLQEAMNLCQKSGIETVAQYEERKAALVGVPEDVLVNYIQRHEDNTHKMKMPEICEIFEFEKV